MEMEKKTIREWEKEYIHFFNGTKHKAKIMDPDGFDRTDSQLWERRFTKEEFERGMMRSTCTFRRIEE